jgi:hypothetical protein
MKLVTGHDEKLYFFLNWSQNQPIKPVMTRLVTKATRPSHTESKFLFLR